MSDEIKNVFVSHVHEDDEHVQGLVDIAGRNGVVIRNSSIDSSRPNDANNEDYIKSSILSPGIRWAGTVVVLISPNTHKSWWVDWEIEYAQKCGKRIVGVYLRGAQEADLPNSLKSFADVVVGWRADSIVTALTKPRDGWFTGPECPPPNIVHVRCQT